MRVSRLAAGLAFLLHAPYAGALGADRTKAEGHPNIVQPPSRKAIARIEKRGREIADYERAAIRATDMFLAAKQERNGINVYFAVHREKTWTVYFGKLSPDGSEFSVAYAYACPEGAFKEMREVTNPRRFAPELGQLARAVRLAGRSIRKQARVRRYNTNVFREIDGTITVYLTPGNTDPKVTLLGGDFRVSLSRDGTKVLRLTRLHNAIIRIPTRPAPKTKKVVAAFHTHVRAAELPTETDVALTLIHPQLANQMIMGRTWLYAIGPRGKIKVLSRSKDFLGQTGGGTRRTKAGPSR